jgi:uncharacterized protein
MTKLASVLFIFISVSLLNSQNKENVISVNTSSAKIQRELNEKLLETVKQGKYEEVQSYLEQGASCDYIDSQEWSVLMHAVHQGNIDIVRRLVECGANINYANRKGFSVSLVACRYERHEILKYLIKREVNITINDHTCYDCMSYAAGGSKSDNLKLLVEIGADINSRDCDGITPLMMASWFTTQAILDLGADINATGNAGNTATMLSIIEGNEPKFKILLKNSPNLAIINKRGDSALDLAIKHDRKNILATLRK